MSVAKLEDPEVAADGVERLIGRHVGWRKRTRWNGPRFRPAFEMSLVSTPNSQLPTPNQTHHPSYHLARCRRSGGRLMSFVIERYPFALPALNGAFDRRATQPSRRRSQLDRTVAAAAPPGAHEISLRNSLRATCRTRRPASRRPRDCRRRATSSSRHATAF